MILRREFYERDTMAVAKELLGKFLAHDTEGETTIGKIVETEAYVGPDDRARARDLKVMMRPRGSGHLSNLTSGPSKLCMAMGISKKQNGADL